MTILNIGLAPWNVEYDFSRKFEMDDENKLDDTMIAASVITQYLKDLGHNVSANLQIPPHNEKHDKPNLFIGVGAGDPLGLQARHLSVEKFDSRLFGVETQYPLGWIGAMNITSYPFSAIYRVYVRGVTGIIEHLDIPDSSGISAEEFDGKYTKPIRFSDRDNRDKAVKVCTDVLLDWYENQSGNSQPIERIPLENNSDFLYDVFLCFNSKDRPLIQQLAERLKAKGIKYFLDEESVRAGTRHQLVIAEALQKSKSIAVCIGAHGIGNWQQLEIEEAVAAHGLRGLSIIPVLLESCPPNPQFPFGVGSFSWVNFREKDEFVNLLNGITG